MKTKKSIYLAALAALAFTACSNDNNEIFEQSAADRLEQYKKDYSEVLTADGGLWSMEYFSNPDEPGYVFVMKFDKNGSVEISANHKWIGGKFQQETSLWKMIADNGPVLSFNSYNNLFHVFSDPANIDPNLPDAPKNEYGDDIVETGYGHEGDYEFQVMEVSEDSKTVRLLGKKRMYDIFLRHLDENTDVENYLIRTSMASKISSSYFDYLNLIDADGEPYIMRGMEKGIISIFPKLGDEVTQTKTSSCIFTVNGLRFMNDFSIPRADEDAEPIVLNSFSFQEDGSLLSTEGVKIVGPYADDVFFNKTLDYYWSIDIDSSKGKFEEAIINLEQGIKNAYPSRSLDEIYFANEVFNGSLSPCIGIKISGAKAAVFYMDYVSESKDDMKFNIAGANSQANTFAKKTTALNDFAEELAKYSYVFSSDNIMVPEVLNFNAKDDSANSFKVRIK